MARVLVAGLALQAAAVTTAQAPVGPATLDQSSAGPSPRIVLQPVVNAFKVAAWLPDSRFLLTSFMFGRELILWDTKLGVVVERLTLPDGAGGFANLQAIPYQIVVAPDGKSALIHALVPLEEVGATKAVDYRANLQDRTVTVVRSWIDRPKTGSKPGLGASMADLLAKLAILTVPGTELTSSTPEDADKEFPLPSSPDGKAKLKRSAEGLKAITGQQTVTLPANKVFGYAGGALAPDGRHLALVANPIVEDEDDDTPLTIDMWDLQSSAQVWSVKAPGNLGTFAWLDADHMAVLPRTASEGRDRGGSSGADRLDDIVIADATTGKTRTVPARCYVKALPAGGLIGAGLAHCIKAAPAGAALQTLDPAGTRWQPLPIALAPGARIDGLAVSPNGDTVAVAVRLPAGPSAIVLMDRATGREVNHLGGKPDDSFGVLAFAGDGKTLAITRNDTLTLWRTGGTELVSLGTTIAPESVVAVDADTVVTSNLLEGNMARFELASGKRLPSLPLTNAVAGGFVPGKFLFWAASYLGEVRLWDSRDWTELLSSHHFAQKGYVTATPQGLYDTNLGPDTPLFRWLVPDAPMQSLAPQTFMRDYFEPNLTERLFECRDKGTCASALPPRPPIAALNRVLPVVRIASVRPSRPGWVTVAVEAQEGVDPQAANGKTRSGLYDVRLFRNNRLVGHQPGKTDEVLHQNLAEWRQANRPASPPDANGIWHLSFEVPLPTAKGTATSKFSVYAFNEDRVKSETAQFTYTRPEVQARPPEAYVLTIGLDAYQEPALTLHYAAKDAKLLGERLAHIPGYTVHPAVLTSEVLPGGTQRLVTKAAVRAALKILVGAPATAEDQAALAGFDVSGLAQVTPDDLVIITYSGHGYANPRGDFFLVPADARRTLKGEWNEHNLISTADLTTYLRDVRAGEIALIIDACHSAASVTAGAFKPGPLGDAGLGQLAYDQGILVLAAAQADDVARESAQLGQGVMTYALAKEGLTPDGGKADRDDRGQITLDTWLRYAVDRTPQISTQLSLGTFSGPATATAAAPVNGTARDLTLFDAKPKPAPKPQVPSLFNFNQGRSNVVMRGAQK